PADEQGTRGEVCCPPHRRDRSAERARRAVAAGRVLTIDSDAHRTRELDFGRWGGTQARRAWVSSSNVVNTRSPADLLAWAAGKPDRIAGCRVRTPAAPRPP